MYRAALILIAVISALHFYIAYVEIFLWETKGPEMFKSFPAELFPQTVTLAANQGIYNAFLAVGLAWSLFIKDPVWQVKVATCFLLFVAAAGIFGAATASMRILLVQTAPAAIALILLHMSKRSDR